MKCTKDIKRRICTIANSLRKMSLTLSAAFKKAWALIKGRTVTTKIAGVTKGSRQKALCRIAEVYKPEDVAVRLERDKANLHDNNAVKVIISVKGSADYNLGFIPRNLAYVVAALLDKGILKRHLKRLEGIIPNI